MNVNSKKVVVLFSGGCDSTLAAAIAAENFKEVCLVTYKRLGLFKTSAPLPMVEKLRKRYPGTVFSFEVIDVDKLFKEICYEHYPGNVRKYGFKLLSACGLCKVAMHWRTILYCLDNDIHAVYDGAVEKSNVFPGQNRRIMLDKLTEVYSRFGIDYKTPVYKEGENAELRLYEKGLIPSKKIKQTERDKQPMCIDNLLFSRFVDYYLGRHSWEEYEKDMAEFYSRKLEYVRDRIEQERGY